MTYVETSKKIVIFVLTIDVFSLIFLTIASKYLFFLKFSQLFDKQNKCCFKSKCLNEYVYRLIK